MPLPPGLVVKNGTNRLSGFGIPGPSSRTRNRRLGPAAFASSPTGIGAEDGRIYLVTGG